MGDRRLCIVILFRYLKEDLGLPTREQLVVMLRERDVRLRANVAGAALAILEWAEGEGITWPELERACADMAAGAEVPARVGGLCADWFGFDDKLAQRDAAALIEWLNDNEYLITSEMEPLIEEYVADGMHFLAMKLTAEAEVTKEASKTSSTRFRVRQKKHTPFFTQPLIPRIRSFSALALQSTNAVSLPSNIDRLSAEEDDEDDDEDDLDEEDEDGSDDVNGSVASAGHHSVSNGSAAGSSGRSLPNGHLYHHHRTKSGGQSGGGQGSGGYEHGVSQRSYSAKERHSSQQASAPVRRGNKLKRRKAYYTRQRSDITVSNYTSASVFFSLAPLGVTVNKYWRS